MSNWNIHDLKAYMTRRLAQEQRARERMQRQPITEAQFQAKISRPAEENRPPMRARSPQALAISGAAKVRAGRGPRSGYNVAVVKAFFKEYGVPEPMFEFRFDTQRKWRADLCWISHEYQLICEVQGGIFTAGRHTRGPAMLREFEKLNRAAALGYRVIFVTPRDLCTKATIDLIRECLGLCHVPDKHIGMAGSLAKP